MSTLQLMLLALLVGATVSTNPTYTEDGFNIEQTIVLQVQSESITPTPQIIYVTPEPTAVPTVAPTKATTVKPASTAKAIDTGTEIRRELTRGCQGDDVKLLQKMLADLNYDVSVDGNFGTQTYNAVVTFQKYNGLSADGVAGTRTIRKLASGSAVPYDAEWTRTSLSYGMSGQDVLELQYRLSGLGYYYDACNGNYLTNTRSAVKWFQQVNSLTVDGVAGPKTLSLLYSASAKPAGDNPPVYPVPTENPVISRTLKKGMSGTDVGYLQQRLKDLGYFTGYVTDYFGSVTYSAVATFQSYNNLSVDGVAGPATISKLFSASARPYPGTATPTPWPPLRPSERPPASPTAKATATATATAANTVTPSPSPSLAICQYCGNSIATGNESAHALADCGSHGKCQSGTHAPYACGAHFQCKESGEHNKLCTVCGKFSCVTNGACFDGGTCQYTAP